MGRGGEKAEKGRVGRGRKNKPKKAKFVCKKKKPRKEKNVSITQFSPPQKKSSPKEKVGLGGGVPEWAEAVLRHKDLTGKDLAFWCVCYLLEMKVLGGWGGGGT